MFANWPYTLIVMLSGNKALMAIPNVQGDAASRSMILEWGRLHAMRSALGCVATLFFWQP